MGPRASSTGRATPDKRAAVTAENGRAGATAIAGHASRSDDRTERAARAKAGNSRDRARENRRSRCSFRRLPPPKIFSGFHTLFCSSIATV